MDKERKLKWFFAEEETPEEKAERLKKEEEAKLEKLKEELTATIAKSMEDKFTNKLSEYDKKIQAYEEKIAKLEEKKKPQEEKKEPKKGDREPSEYEKEIMAKLEENNRLFFNAKKDEIKKEYGLTDEDFAECKTMDDLSNLKKIYQGAFNKAKTIYTSDEKMTEILNKKKKTIIDLADTVGEEEQKKKHEDITKAVFNLLK